jgi:hypothetical protein
VLTALDSLPEDVGLEGTGTPPKSPGCSDKDSGRHAAPAEQHEHPHEQEQQQPKPKHKGGFQQFAHLHAAACSWLASRNKVCRCATCPRSCMCRSQVLVLLTAPGAVV